ncbi:O-phosphoserine--tRNA ligase [Candidatus Bathyarchaeota archaeon]|nr:MAG: O-phosphoserine--tRNA ligase [Candidatus Bathyarchaeota archaeon]
MAWDPKGIREKARRDYESAWLETAKLLRAGGRFMAWPRAGGGKPHPVCELIQRLRSIFLSYGFEEVLNPTIVPDAEVRRQYGPEAPVILDRVFYLAGLPRPDIGISREHVEKITGEIVPGAGPGLIEGLKAIFRAYKEGRVEADDLVEEMVKRLGIRPEQATAILALFPELATLTPIPTRLTLRSHMTALWFPVLAALQDKRPLPIKLFSIGLKWRREQKLDESHLYDSHVASLVVMAERISLEDGEELVRAILADLAEAYGNRALEEARFVVKEATSKYYAPGMEMEVFVRHGGTWVEVGDIGLYSPVSLANYDIRYPVFNAGLGVERLAMILYGYEDMRLLAYPQLYAEVEFTDEQLANMIGVGDRPTTPEGLKLAEAIVRAAEANKDLPSPCEILAYEGPLMGREVRVYLYEPEPGVKLLGPAALNHVCVEDGSILGLPEPRGVDTGLRYIDAIAMKAAREVEEAAREGRASVDLRIKMAKRPSDVNIAVDDVARRYITSRRKRIEIRGPVFVGIRAEIS